MSSVMRLMGISVPKPNVGGFNLQSSAYGLPIPIVYGKARVAGNLMHMPAQPKKTSSGGKGKGAKGVEIYAAALAIGICEGPIVGIGNVWRDKDAKVDFSTYSSKGWSLFLGTSSQSPWSYLTSNYPSQAIPYQFTAYVAGEAVDLPNNSMHQYAWEVKGFAPFGGGIDDANFADVVEDFLTDPQHGCNFDAAMLGDLTVYRDYCAAAGLFGSPVVDSQQPGRDIINEWMEVSNSAAVWSDGVLKFIPYGDVPLSANGHTYTPNTTPLYDLGDNDFLPNSATDQSQGGGSGNNGDLDPILFTRTDPAEAYNQVTVKYEDRDYDYNLTPYETDDAAAILQYGALPLPPMELHSIKLASVAQQVAQLRLQREQNVRNTYTFNLGWKYSLLEPMDLVTLTDVGLGMNFTPVRIISVQEMDGEQGLTFTAEDWPFGSASATLYATGSADGTKPDANIDPGDTSAPIIIESPTQLALSPLDILLGASGGPNWGGCQVWMSVDNVNFTLVGNIYGQTAYGTLTTALATGTAWPGTDSANTLSVDISGTDRTLDTQTSTQFDALQPLCYVGGEFLAYETATLTGTGLYDLTTLYRGLYNSTIPASHPIGTSFVFIDQAMIRIPWPQGAAGQTVYFKLPAFNIYGGGQQDLSAVSSFTYVLGSDPIPFGGGGIPQGTVAIDSNGTWNATADGPSSTQSYKWLASTSAFPSDASVISGGTLENGRTFSIVAGGTLAFGETVYISIVPYNYVGGVGTPGASIHIRGSYQTYSASKTAYYPYSGFFTTDTAQATRAVATISGQAGVVWFAPNNFATFIDNPFEQGFTLPDGAVITGVVQDMLFNDAAGLGLHTTAVAFSLIRIDSSGAQTVIATGSATNTTPSATWQSIASSTISENTTGNKYMMQVLISRTGVNANTTYLSGAVGGFSVAYDSDKPTTTL